jgi:hypothetical protein
MNVLIPGPIASPQRMRSHPGEERGNLRTVESAASAFLYLLGPEGAVFNGESLEL